MSKRKILSILALCLALILVVMTSVPIYSGGAQWHYLFRDLKWYGYPFVIFDIVFMVAAFVLCALSFIIKNRAKLFITLSVSITWFSGIAIAIETLFHTEYGIIPLISYCVLCAPVLIWNLIMKNEAAEDSEKDAQSNAGGKPLSFIKAIARYNMPGFICEICGPVTGFGDLRAKRISKIKGKIVMWEAKCVDVTFEDGDIDPSSAVVWGLNSPLKVVGTNEIIYCSYIDVEIKGQINRIQIPVAKIPGPFEDSLAIVAAIKQGRFPFKTLPQPTAGSVPVVSGWIKDLSRPLERDEHFDDPICPKGYSALILGYFVIQPLYTDLKFRNLGLPANLLDPPEYIREKSILFDHIPCASIDSDKFVGSNEMGKPDTAPTSNRGPRFTIGKREFKKSEVEQLFSYFWVCGYNSLEFKEANEKCMRYFADNGYIDGKTISQNDITGILSFIWASKYNLLTYSEAIEKIVDYLQKSES